ncbi:MULTISPECIES: protein translocase subunit SecD [Streptomyces]|uniref:Protein translocase subunit SecD n=2 Tax=Streptomyces TaxID=1883 RepID=A0A3R7FGE1_9ACTN|nr:MULTISPECIES: protein translocase subunit SecD [Streptomyces]KNE79547.1 preprotein translocase subunit SecD [Streptomyces fradiae]OFA37721.1 protein-export membrane protein SecD [Streptomyces fradiae]PQM22428.1 protein translocase subunit SecD [Streptomyces xinghaiensis]RKM96605.1 protein translocase subunit SecD [Streptomyces xinghaiensis]RNC74243.1 protein translocase subunit SecD [Streptomyces xinghaiensis]
MAAPKKGRRPSGAQGRPGRTLVLFLIAVVALTGGMFLSGHTTPRLGIDLAGGTTITLTAKNQPGEQNAINQTNMNTAVGIIDRRVNGLGVTEAEVTTQGDRNIVVNLPKGTDEEQAREQVGTTAQLQFRPVLGAAQGAPAPEPTGSPSAGADDEGKNGDKAGESGEKDAESAEPSPSATTQGRALTDALAADASEKPEAAPTQSPGETGTPQAPEPESGIPAELQKKLDALDCSKPEERAKAGEGDEPGDNTVACDQEGTVKYALGPTDVAGTEVDDAKALFDSQTGKGWVVTLDFNGKGAEQFADATERISQQQPNQFAIVLDGEVVSAPSVDTRIGGGNAEISGSFTQQSAEDLANVLSYGALPLSFEESNVTTISPTLGSEQLKAGLIAGAIGLALVVLYLFFYYRVLGLVAVSSLVAAALLTYVIMTLLGPAIGFALSLPAVCGAIVAIGITADSFIVYFERIRDEIREGRTVRSAFFRAWPSARRTILVSDVVSIIAAVVLFIVSVGSVQGFAFVLGLTTAVDIAIVFFLTKPLMTILSGRTFFTSGHPQSGLDPKRLGASPPLRGRRRPALATTDPKEA